MIQCLGVKLKWYLKPLLRIFSSFLEKDILALFITVGWKLCGASVVFFVWCWCFIWLSSFLSRCL